MAARAGTPALQVLARAGVAHRVHEYVADPDAPTYGEGAAAALGIEPRRMLKTLVARLSDGRLAVAVLPVTATLDLKALGAALGAKGAVLADAADATRVTGYVPGGISPLGHRRLLPSAVDAAVTAPEQHDREEHDPVYVSAGRRGLAVSLAPADLVRLTDAVVGVLSRPGTLG